MEFPKITNPGKPLIDPGQIEAHALEAATLLKLLANQHRLMILCTLVQGEMSVSEINEHIGLSQSALSQHLALLRKENIVKTRRQSQTILYSLAQDHTTRIIQVLQELYCSQPEAESAEQN